MLNDGSVEQSGNRNDGRTVELEGEVIELHSNHEPPRITVMNGRPRLLRTVPAVCNDSLGVERKLQSSCTYYPRR